MAFQVSLFTAALFTVTSTFITALVILIEFVFHELIFTIALFLLLKLNYCNSILTLIAMEGLFSLSFYHYMATQINHSIIRY